MFSQSSLDQMSIDELTNLIKSMANEVASRINDPEDAIDYCNALSNLSDCLRDRIECVMED